MSNLAEAVRFAEALATITKTLAPSDPLAQLIIKAAEAKVPVKCETCKNYQKPPPGQMGRICASSEPDWFCTDWEAKR